MGKTLISIKRYDDKFFIVVNDESLDLSKVKAIRMACDVDGITIEVDKIDAFCKDHQKEITEKLIYNR